MIKKAMMLRKKAASAVGIAAADFTSAEVRAKRPEEPRTQRIARRRVRAGSMGVGAGRVSGDRDDRLDHVGFFGEAVDGGAEREGHGRPAEERPGISAVSKNTAMIMGGEASVWVNQYRPSLIQRSPGWARLG